MPRYEVKAWITVEAESVAEAEEKATAILENLPEGMGFEAATIEGEGSTYRICWDGIWTDASV